ncbi:nonstructural protein [Callinectes danae portunibunyavirus 1]|uniref:Nonstructural protein n=1 Tax=Callinectes danae portunibunyavirus 1 TaxID=2878267 RepID=A0A8K1HRG4_9VIRU|nr:nonstructural protein [Callinectes danae portunibunyavirus 1]
MLVNLLGMKMSDFTTSLEGNEFQVTGVQAAFSFDTLYQEFSALNIKTDALKPLYVLSKNLRDRVKNETVFLKLKNNNNHDVRIVLRHDRSDQGVMTHKRFFACVARYLYINAAYPDSNPLAASVGITPDKREFFTLYTSGMEFNFSLAPAKIAAIAKLQKRDLGYTADKFYALTRQSVNAQPFENYVRGNEALITAEVAVLGRLTSGSAIGARAQRAFDSL